MDKKFEFEESKGTPIEGRAEAVREALFHPFADREEDEHWENTYNLLREMKILTSGYMIELKDEPL